MDQYPLIDTHCHVTDAPFSSDGDRFLTEWNARGVVSMMVPSYDRPSSMQALDWKRRHPDCWVAIGVHPMFLPSDISFLKESVMQAPVAAIGEIGLDLRRGAPSPAIQETALRVQLESAGALGLPVIIHCVQAHGRMLAILADYPGVRGVIHRVSCSWEVAREYLRRGWFLGIGPDLLRPEHRQIPGIVERMPEERIVLETDSPYVRMPDGRMAEPPDVGLVLERVSRIRQTPIDRMARVMMENACRLFGKPMPR